MGRRRFCWARDCGENALVSGIFISYRRQDAASYAGRLRGDLAQRYGHERVFLDIADLAPGKDWTKETMGSWMDSTKRARASISKARFGVRFNSAPS